MSNKAVNSGLFCLVAVLAGQAEDANDVKKKLKLSYIFIGIGIAIGFIIWIIVFAT